MQKYKNSIFFVIVVAVIIIILVLSLRNKNSGNKTPVKKPADVKEPTLKPIIATASAMEVYKKLPSGSFPVKKGQKSKLVFLIQYSLNLLYGASLALDGDFGGKTQIAVSKHLLGTADVSKDLAIKLFIAVGKNPQCDPAMFQAIKDINLFPTYYAN